eukprot:gene538-20279_t
MRTNDCASFCAETGRWRREAPARLDSHPPWPRSGHTGVMWADHLFVFGGVGDDPHWWEPTTPPGAAAADAGRGSPAPGLQGQLLQCP